MKNLGEQASDEPVKPILPGILELVSGELDRNQEKPILKLDYWARILDDVGQEGHAARPEKGRKTTVDFEKRDKNDEVRKRINYKEVEDFRIL